MNRIIENRHLYSLQRKLNKIRLLNTSCKMEPKKWVMEDLKKVKQNKKDQVRTSFQEIKNQILKKIQKNNKKFSIR